MPDYEILPELMLRTPALPYHTFQATNLQGILERPDFRAALFLANSSVYNELKRHKFQLGSLSKKMALTVYNYANRMAYRTTPFGAFSSFSFLANEIANNGITIKESGFRLHISPDLEEFLLPYFTLIDSFTNELRTNSSIYSTAVDGRYLLAETNNNGPFTFSTRNFERNPAIESLLKFANEPRPINMLIEKLNSLAMTDDEAKEFVNDLRAAQLLLPSNMPSIIGKDAYHGFLSASRQYEMPLWEDPATHISENMVLGKPAFYQLPDAGYKSPVTDGKDLKFYSNLECQAQGGIPKNITESLHNALFALGKLSISEDAIALSAFKKAFKKRFDLRTIPLMEAIDPEMGISYDNLAAPVSKSSISGKIMPFVEMPGTGEPLQWGKIQRLLLNNWPGSPEGVIVISKELLDELDDHHQTMPPSFSMLFRVCEELVQIDQAGGTSATALLGRFTPFSCAIRKHAKQIADMEAMRNPEVIFAEVAMISDAHVDNVNRREAIRNFEIQVMTGSHLPEEQTIKLSDLFLLVRGNELILWSAKLKRRIIPRISSAFNYRRNNLAVFRLLGDLQYQSVHHTFSFDLQTLLPGLSFYPRITYKNCILSLATWNIYKKDLTSPEKRINQGKDIVTPEHFMLFAKKIGLSKTFALTVSDRALVYRLENTEDVKFFLAEINTLEVFNLKEVLLEPPLGGTVTDVQGNTFSNQFIASIINPKASYSALENNPPVISPDNTDREMIIGSEWLYYKLYGQPFNANAVLLRLNKVLRALKKTGTIERWFFIRYRDPNPHLRLRVHLQRQALGKVMILLEKHLKKLHKKYKITEIVTATYQRELERYPKKLISLIEKSFCQSTELVIKAINVQNRYHNSLPHYLIGVVPVFWLIRDWINDPAERLIFIANIKDNLFTEFGGSPALKLALDETKRSLKTEATHFLDQEDFFSLYGLNREWRAWNLTMSTLGRAAKKNREKLLADLLHMHFNRVFYMEMREQELVAYILIHQYETTSQKMRK